MKMNIEDCIKDSQEWDELTEQLLKQVNINSIEDFPKLVNGKPDVFILLKAIYNHFFDYKKEDEIGCGHFVFALTWENCLSFDKMLEASNKLAYYKDGSNKEKVPVPIFKYSKYDLIMMHAIKEIMIRVNKKLHIQNQL